MRSSTKRRIPKHLHPCRGCRGIGVVSIGIVGGISDIEDIRHGIALSHGDTVIAELDGHITATVEGEVIGTGFIVICPIRKGNGFTSRGVKDYFVALIDEGDVVIDGVGLVGVLDCNGVTREVGREGAEISTEVETEPEAGYKSKKQAH